jgi:hypothetical protein
VLVAPARLVIDLMTGIEANARRCIRTGFFLGHDGSCPAVRTSMPGCGNMFPPKPQRAVPSSRRIGIPLMIGRRRPASDLLFDDLFYRVSSTWAAASASRR